MEAAVVHLDRPAAMPSQSQMSYRGSSGLHGRQSQSQAAEVCYKSGSSVGGSGVGVGGVSGSSSSSVSSASQRGHSPATYSGSANANYAPMRYIHPSYTPTPGATAVSTYRDYLRENPSRSSAIVGDRQTVEYLPGQVKPRISILSSSEYLALSRNRQLQNDNYRDSLGPSNLPPLEVNPIPVKKIRLGEPKDIQRNLRIDTRDDGQQAAAYTPKVEAISPTLPSEVQQDDANFRSTKDDLLHGISKVDREIIDTELQISKLKKKLQDLEEAAKQPTIKTEEEEIPQPTHQSPAQKIYAENRRKAQEAHMLLKNLGPKIELPLYNQPSDTTVYHENKRRHLIFKKRLLINLRKKHIERENRQKRLTSTYSEMVQDWLRKVEKVENSQKRKAKDAKNREFFEKIFPKLRKQREDRERFNRVGARVKSEADLEEIMDGLQEQELEDKKMRSYAVVPPMLLDAKQRSIFYINNNGKLDDFATEYKERQLLNIWTQAEKDIFKEKFLQHPKNFGAIASYLDKKSVCDCVQYYYLSKKTENYKRLLRKHRVATRSRRNPQSKVNSGNVNSSSLDILATATGVTTRLQREQLQKQEPAQNSTTASQSHCDITDFMLTPQSHPINPQSPQLLPLEKKLEKEKSDVKDSSKKKKEDEETTDDDLSDPINNQIVNKNENADPPENSEPLSGGDSENTHNTVACIVCKTESNCTRALPRYQASQYSLKEEDIPADARVCNLCRCKAVRSRFTNCPIPTCPNSKGFKVKRLRPLPCKWADLPAHVKDPIVAEFQIDDSVTKCCSACYNRIVRRIGVHNDPASSGDTVTGPPSPSNPWTEKEITNLKSGLILHGTRWHGVAGVVMTRTHSQCMKFFFQQKKALGLDQYLPHNTKDLVDERKPVLTDEEESGSSTSSCDEMDAVPANDSDTASAPSPVHPPGPLDDENKVRCDGTPPPQLIQEGRVSVGNDINDRSNASSSPHGKMPGPGTPSLPPVLVPNREDYDSSATETADEGQGGGESESGANRGPTPKREEEPSSPLTVKDLMLGVIEMQLMKNQGQGQSANTPGGPPTISSILKTDHTVGYIPREKSRQVDNSLATVSVVNTHHTHQPMQETAKENLVVVQVQPGIRSEQRESDGVTLDLSIKKPRNESTSTSKNIIQHHIQSNTPVQSPHNIFKSQSGDQPTYFHQQVLAPPLTPKLSPGIISSSGNTVTTKSQCGSIIHGTPVSSPNIYSQSRYEPSQTSLIHHTSPHKETGSITQGTPVHQRSTLYTHSSEYFHKRMPSYYHPTRPSAYNVELEQRQIIMNDYITSQQMHASGSSSGPRNGREKMYYQPTSRQGVIQRHNTKPPSPGTSHYPPGHEAFSSLVDVAVRQPSLPVPPHSGMAPLSEIKNMQEEKRHLHEGLGERFNRESSHERYSNRESDNRYIKENAKIHNPPSSMPSSQERRDIPQPSLIHIRESSHIRDQMPMTSREQMSHGSREYRHMERAEMQQSHQRDSMHRERSEHHSQSSQKIRDHHHHMQPQRERDHDIRSVRGQIPSFPPRIIHESHHPIDQRLIQVPSFREQPTSTQASITSHSRGHQQDQSHEVQQSSRRGDSSTLTAASLIDAIITHQINQSADPQTTSAPSGNLNAPQPQVTRPGDRLFQSFHRECNESNGKVSPMKSYKEESNSKQSAQPPPQSHSTQPSQQSGQPQQQLSQPPPQPSPQQTQQQTQQGQHPPLHVVSTSVHVHPNIPTSEHMDMYNSPPSQGMRSVLYHGFDPQTWKLRRALQSKDVEQNHPAISYAEPPVPLSPLDYVKNRIAEVMRTSEEEGASSKGNESPAPSEVNADETNEPSIITTTSFIAPSHTYTYPFSALSLSAGATAGVPPPLPPPKVSKQTISESIPEPAPLLSAQYDPLSDED